MARKVKTIALLMMVLLMATIVACTPAGKDLPETVQPPADTKDGGTARFRLAAEVATMNPFYAGDAIGGQLNAFMAERLVRLNNEAEYVGQLASSWTIDDSGLVWDFHLVDAKWHDGEPFTADDVIFSYELTLNPDAAIGARTQWYVDDNPIKMEKIDDHHVRLTLPEPYAPVLTTVAGMALGPKHLLDSIPVQDIRTCEWSLSPVHTGPFKFVSYQAGEYIEMERFDDYWGGKPYLDRVIFQIIPDQNAAVVALETNQVDFADVPADSFNRLAELDNLETFRTESGNVQFMVMNNQVFPFDDVRVRKAVSHCIDRETLIDQVQLGLATPAYNFMVPTDMFYNDKVIVKYEYDLEKAKELLTDAGYTPGSDGILQRDGQKLEIECIYTSRMPERAVVILQADLAKIGIKLVPKVMEWAAQLELHAKPHPKPYQCVFAGNTLGPDPNRYSIVYAPSAYPGGANYLGYLGDNVEELFEAGRAEIDPQKRQKIYEELQTVVTDDAAVGWLWYAETLYAYSPKLNVSEAEMTGLAHIRFFDPAKIYIEQ